MMLFSELLEGKIWRIGRPTNVIVAVLLYKVGTAAPLPTSPRWGEDFGY